MAKRLRSLLTSIVHKRQAVAPKTSETSQDPTFQVLKRVKVVKPAGLRPSWGHMLLAAHDMTSPYNALVIKNCPHATYHLLKNAALNLQSDMLLRCNMPADADPKAIKANLQLIGQDLLQIAADKTVTLQVYWNAESEGAQHISLASLLGGAAKAGAAGDDEDESALADDDGANADEEEDGAGGSAALVRSIKALADAAQLAHPGIKTVVFTPATNLPGSDDLTRVEVYDAGYLGDHLDKDGYELKAAGLGERFEVAADAKQLTEALQGVSFKNLGRAFRDAAVLANRAGLVLAAAKQEEYTVCAPQLQHLQLAAERLRYLGTSNVGEALKYEVELHDDEAEGLQQAPQGVQDFAQLVRNFATVHKLAPKAERTLLLSGDAPGQLEVVRALSASLGAKLLVPSREALIRMVVGKGKSLGKFLDQANTLGHRHDGLTVVYLADLVALLRLVDAKSDEGTLVRDHLAELLGGAGTKPERDRLVLVGSTDDSEIFGPSLLNRFGAHAFIAKVDPSARARIWRALLTEANSDISDEALNKVLADCEGFSRQDIQRAIEHAAAYAVRTRGAEVPHLTVKDLRAGIAEQRQSVTARQNPVSQSYFI